MNKEGNETLIGATVTQVRPMTEQDYEDNYWSEYFMGADRGAHCVIELDTGARILAMRDPEGNGPGTLVIQEADGKQYYAFGWSEDAK